MNNILLALLIIHFIADYYLQSEPFEYKKKESYIKVIKHSAIYTAASLIMIVPVWSNILFSYMLLFSVSHFTIDTIKHLVMNLKLSKIKEYEVIIYFSGQLFHIGTILLISLLMIHQGLLIKPIIAIQGFNFNKAELLRSVLGLILIFKPVNVTFKIAYAHIKNSIPTVTNELGDHHENGNNISNKKKSKKIQDKELNVGRIIGNLERLLVLILLSVNEYSAIGLIFTAKSITRYNEISTNKAFAEYYLLGTLYSILATVLIYQSVFVWLK